MFSAIKLPPDGNVRLVYYSIVRCNQIKNFIVLEVDELIVNNKETLEEWWDYPLLSDSGLTQTDDETRFGGINTNAWLREPPSPKSKFAERIYSLEATNTKKHIIPLKINFSKKFFDKTQTNVQLPMPRRP